MNEYEDENPEYWEDYNNLQRVKHELLRYYLGGWFFILSKWSQIVYIDCHAGRGKHEGGQIGSPLIALETLLNHKELSQILRSCEIRFFFIEADIENKQTLEANLAKYNRPRFLWRLSAPTFRARFRKLLMNSTSDGHPYRPHSCLWIPTVSNSLGSFSPNLKRSRNANSSSLSCGDG